MYTHQKEYHRANAVALQGTGVKTTFSPGVRPFKLRSVAVVVTLQNTVTPPVLTIKRRPTAGSATGEVTVTTLTVPLARLPGEIVYKNGLDETVSPGEQLVADLTTASTAGAGDIVLEFDPKWDQLTNNAKAYASA
jgi:hypothetical protein